MKTPKTILLGLAALAAFVAGFAAGQARRATPKAAISPAAPDALCGPGWDRLPIETSTTSTVACMAEVDAKGMPVAIVRFPKKVP